MSLPKLASPLRWNPGVLAFLLGVLHTVGFVHDKAWPLEIAAIAGLAALIVRTFGGVGSVRVSRRVSFRAARAAGRIGLMFGLGWFLSGIHWIFVSLHTYGDMNAALAAAATFLLCAYLALYPALACGLTILLLQRQRLPPRWFPWVFASFWTLSEVARGLVLTGFPWLASGYAHVASPLAGYAPSIGVYGIGFLVALIAASTAMLAARKPGGTSQRTRSDWMALSAIVIGLPVLGIALGHIDWTRPHGAPLRVRLLQGNIPQDLKFAASHFSDTANVYLSLLEKQPANAVDLTVLPETAFPRFLSFLPEQLVLRLKGEMKRLGSAIAFGVPVDESGSRYFNSVVAITHRWTPDGVIEYVGTQRYNKSHLVPFGEFVPTGFHWFVESMHIPLGDFTRGQTHQLPMLIAEQRIAFDICYEDLFGELIASQARYANVLANVSNVAWFGNSLALPQHLQISRMRAIETGKPVLRSTNTGMTAVIDGKGIVLGRLPPFKVGALSLSVQPTVGWTPYVRFGDGTVVGIALSILLLAMASRDPRGGPDAPGAVVAPPPLAPPPRTAKLPRFRSSRRA